MSQAKQSEAEALLQILELGQKQIEAGEFILADEFFKQMDLEEQENEKPDQK